MFIFPPAVIWIASTSSSGAILHVCCLSSLPCVRRPLSRPVFGFVDHMCPLPTDGPVAQSAPYPSSSLARNCLAPRTEQQFSITSLATVA